MKRLLLLASLMIVSVLTTPIPARAAAPGAPTDRNIDLVGRWDTTDPTAFVPQWAGAYLRVGFTGTSAALDQRGTIDFWYSIDGGPYTLVSGVSGTVDLTATPLPAGRHSLLVSYRIVAGSYTGDAVFRGLTLGAGERTYRLPRPRRATEWIGDSITAVVVINIGTNDVGHGVAAADVLTAYEHLLRIVRKKNPHAVILALRIFKGWWAAETQQAVLNRQAAGDHDVSYVDTTGWWDPASMTNDGTHPNDHGHRVLAGYLQPFVAAALERCAGA